MLITSCGNSEYIAKTLAKKLHAAYSPLTISHFPDGDFYLRFNTSLKGKTVVLVQSFQPHPDNSLLHVVFAGATAKDLGAKKIILIAPYLAYMRQDARFHPGEAISSKIVGKLLSRVVDKIITFDPHIHRYKSLKEVFSCSATKLTANELIADYIQKHWKKPLIIGPDWESYQWAEKIAKSMDATCTVFEKTRHSSRHVEVRMVKEVPVKGKEVVIVDDIISTGHTMIEAAKVLKKMGARTITAIGIHGLFVEGAYEKMKKAGFGKIITTNCIEHLTNGIDITGMVVGELKKE